MTCRYARRRGGDRDAPRFRCYVAKQCRDRRRQRSTRVRSSAVAPGSSRRYGKPGIGTNPLTVCLRRPDFASYPSSRVMPQATDKQQKTAASAGRIRIGIDVGGTFTDVVLEAGGARTSAKVLTTSQAPEKGVIDGLQEALRKAGLAPGDVGLLLHGTTLATNAVIERARRQDRLHHDGRLPRHSRSRLRDSLRPVRPDDREGDADRPAPAALHRAGARRCARPHTRRPRRGGRPRARAETFRGQDRERRRRVLPRLCQPGPRTAGRGDPRRRPAVALGDARLGSMSGGPGI